MSVQGSTEDSDEYSDESDPKRPNRWTGPPSTWQSLTEQERGLTASLDQLRNQDLSIHLYLAHSLKRRARECEKEKNKQEREIENSDVAEKTFIPPKVWIAWPLPPDEVPRKDEHFGPQDENAIYTFKRKDRERSSRELEEVLIGLTLKFAKETFEARDWADEDLELEASGDELDPEKLDKAEAVKLKGVDRSDQSEEILVSDLLHSNAMNDGSLARDIVESSESRRSIGLRPVVSMDDDRSRQILRPSIRHTLSKLDQVLMALHHARKTCLQYSQSDANTDDESLASVVGENSQGVPMKRPVGRPRKFANLPERPRVDRYNPGSDVDEILQSKKPPRGRPRKQYDCLDGETKQEYLVRVAKIQKKAIPSFTTPNSMASKPSENKEPSLEKPKKESRNISKSRALRAKKLNLRDWSEVLGSAAVVGFNPDVIARATQRCANLFNEGMTMMAMDEGAMTDPITHYQPEKIPDLEIVALQLSDSSSSGSELLSLDKASRRQMSLSCPITDCLRQTHTSYALQKHLEKTHKLMQDEIDLLIGSDEEMDGVVHIDGFLRPIKSKRGWRGKDTKERKKGRLGDDDLSYGVKDDDSMSGI